MNFSPGRNFGVTVSLEGCLLKKRKGAKSAEGEEQNLISYVPVNWGAAPALRGKHAAPRPYKRFERIVQWDEWLISAMRKRSLNQAEADADENFKRCPTQQSEYISRLYLVNRLPEE
jgi:hypothetical protein